MTQALENNFIKPLAEFYGRHPFGKGFALRLDPYAKGMTGEALEAVATRLIERHKAFPSFAQCKDAIASADAALKAPRGTEVRSWDRKALDAERWAARLEAVKLCRCELGREADRAGWLCALIDFAVARGRLPNGLEINACKAVSRRSDEGLDAVRGGPLYASMVAFRQNMLDRAHRDVFGEAAQTLQAAE